MKNKLLLLVSAALLALLCFRTDAYAGGNLDEIRNFTVTADVNDDGTVNMTYHIEWEVLDSDSMGPLSWCQIGIPNSHVTDCVALTDTISSLSPSYSYIRVDLDREYYEGETVTFEYSFTQDYLYMMNELIEGETRYTFTPAWFDEACVDELVIRWNSDKATSWNPSCSIEGDYLVWESTSLYEGERTTVYITYPNDAFAFDVSKTIGTDYDDGSDPYSDYSSNTGLSAVLTTISTIIIAIIVLVFSSLPIIIVIVVIVAVSKYSKGKGLGSGTVKKVTRTKIEYYPNCQGCGAVRQEGEKNCSYCGRSFVKSEETVTEEEAKKLNLADKEGTYRSGTDSNVFYAVHVTHVPAPRTTTRSSGGGSSCAHSSCACASHCACACACACASSGRAGCSNKDFFNTNLKLKQLELKKSKKR